ncbi:MAG: cytochrome c biogenesis protein CcsA [Candidatus Eisenbacteria bacterium]|uniref:Cytochrome c biogenesis protein CcsA n=1 Tax=Eiseniibacteriota bacterium TaxID=2212470 RepID=A0A948W7C7_UNCEI|nr:cytochrome c biogenesis protein CcsA [Candidatus Eisenbacteria bacterium]MBU1948069.1 cytochrome c biogenesis protein CcsA [Candidatus Eisenbacteria bacterium]MBU2691496.1 cytochrome c biogenesis protein CcsA [Candidatus Eisenbacteria bacterium]
MPILLSLTRVLLPISYLVLWASYLWDFCRNEPVPLRWRRGLSGATILIHLAAIINRTMVYHRIPMGTPLEFCSLLALSILVIYIIIEERLKVRETGILILGLAFLLEFISSAFMYGQSPINPLLRKPGFVGHVILVLLSYTALCIGFLYAVLYLVQARQLASRNFGLLFRRLPPLEKLERMSMGAYKLGVPLLFGSLILGYLWMHSISGQVDKETASTISAMDPKIIGSWLVFICYSVCLIGYQFLGWRGRRMNIFTIAAFLIMVFVIALIHHFFPSFHNFRFRG